MEWRDEGIILGSRRHGETSVILETMTRGHGRHLGLVRGGRSRKWQPVLQAGNRVDLVWRARLDEHLGAWQVEPIEANAARLFGSAAAVFALQTFAAHLRLIPERDSHPGLYDLLSVAVRHLDDVGLVGELVARFELRVLEELGFGLDLSQCAATGSQAELVYVSPRSARAVSRAAGEPWADRLLGLPAFLLSAAGGRAGPDAVDSAFRLTGYFMSRHVWEPRGMPPPDVRASLIAALRRPSERDSAA